MDQCRFQEVFVYVAYPPPSLNFQHLLQKTGVLLQQQRQRSLELGRIGPVPHARQFLPHSKSCESRTAPTVASAFHQERSRLSPSTVPKSTLMGRRAAQDAAFRFRIDARKICRTKRCFSPSRSSASPRRSSLERIAATNHSSSSQLVFPSTKAQIRRACSACSAT